MKSQLWQNLEDQAHWILEHADQSPPKELLRGMALHLRLWNYTESGSHTSWSLILPVREYRERRAVVRELRWDRAADWKQTMTLQKTLKRRPLPSPSIQLRDAEADWAELVPFLDTAGGLPVLALGKDPALPSKGDTSGFEGFRPLAHLRLEWAGKGPRGWGETVVWFSRFRNLFVRILKERDTEPRNE
ncbi:MAG TPA: hypothetical protein VE981_12020 [Planctomycetota bacterium]|nr:hypothetical protein [Planctomycetota bacterium]